MPQSVGNVEPVQRCAKTFKVSELRSKKTEQVLFLEAGKDFVDTLLSFLLLPIGTIIYILSQGVQVKTFGGISSIFESVKELDSSFLHVDKRNLVQPMPAAARCTCGSGTGLQFRLDLEAANILQSPAQKRLVLPHDYYKCAACSGLSSTRRSRCETCCKKFGQNCYGFSQGPYSAQEKDPTEEVNRSKGFVKDNIAFIVTDKLEIMPSTTITSISVLNKLGFASLADLESIEITVSITQILELLHSALTSDSCLNNVFGKK